ncbi:MAG: hypothetical protein KGL95_06425, partial [Patescibacteria group bacterium]|nr:hypothetical protein [Patescibacteria group bacterium]
MKFSKKQYAIIGVLFVLGAFLVYQLFGSLRLGYVKSTYLSPKAVAAEKTVSTRPLITFFIPTPTPTPTPTPVYTGYCLNVPVLMYHHTAPWEIAKTKGYTSLDVDNGVFDLQMGYLASHGYNTIFAEDLVNALRNHSSLPQKSIVV